MTLQILDGQLQSTFLPLQQNYVFSGNHFNDTDMRLEHAKINLDHNFNWRINGLAGSKLRVSTDEMDSISLIPGLIFHIGQTGFKVVERKAVDPQIWESESIQFISSLSLSIEPAPEAFFFLWPVQITFVQGPQAGDIYTLSYGPRTLGLNNLDLNIKDPSQPYELLKFNQLGDSIIVKNCADQNSILVNKNKFTEYTLASENRFVFGLNIIDISILK